MLNSVVKRRDILKGLIMSKYGIFLNLFFFCKICNLDNTQIFNGSITLF